MAGVPPSEVVPEMCSTGPVLVLFQGQPVGGEGGGGSLRAGWRTYGLF